MKRTITIISLLLLTLVGLGQNDTNDQEVVESKPSFKFQLDSRKTFVNRESVSIFGVRAGFLFNEKIETGLGIYSSNLFGLLGKEVRKDYKDKSVFPAVPIPSKIGFHYFSIYGEYTLIKSERLILTANSQFGLGWVDINFVGIASSKESIREGKTLLENSIKVNIKTFEWARLIGGIGYRFLLAGEPQIKETFNAPIYIVGFSIDFKKIFKRT